MKPWLFILILSVPVFGRCTEPDYSNCVEVGIHGVFDIADECKDEPSEDSGGYEYYFTQGIEFESWLPKYTNNEDLIEECEYSFVCSIQFAPTYEQRAFVIYKAWRYEVCSIDKVTGEFNEPKYTQPCLGCIENANVLFKFFNKSYNKAQNKTKNLKRIHDLMCKVMRG